MPMTQQSLQARRGIKNVFVTNGYMTKEALTLIKPYLDAANVDLKFFDEKTHQKICGAKRNPVLETIKLMHELGIWVEVTTLIIPTLNDSDEELRQDRSICLQCGARDTMACKRLLSDI